MNAPSESTDRHAIDYAHFALVFVGFIVGLAGVVTSSVAAAVAGLVLIAFGMAYFVMED